eukprot:Hpha_TRINITY_DN30593_c0_g1::TRINITY_DN30593_c0_g1_i1::g.193687::m.193687
MFQQEEEPQQRTHYVVVQHGLGGLPSDWDLVVERVRESVTPDAGNVVLISPSDNSSPPQWGSFRRFLQPGINGQGVRPCADRLAARIRSDVKPPCTLSCAGHSMGGLMLRLAFEKLEREHPEWWGQVVPKTFVTIATPHLGVGAFMKALMGMWYGPDLLTGCAGGPTTSKPLQRFQQMVLYACPDDPLVPFHSGLASPGAVPPRRQSSSGGPCCVSGRSASPCSDDPIITKPTKSSTISGRIRSFTSSRANPNFGEVLPVVPEGEPFADIGISLWCVHKAPKAQGHTMGIVGNDQIDHGVARHVARQLLLPPPEPDTDRGAEVASRGRMEDERERHADPTAGVADGGVVEPRHLPRERDERDDGGSGECVTSDAAGPFPPPPPDTLRAIPN